MEPFDVADTSRMGVFSDPSGAVFRVWQANQHKGAQLVNEPSTWNWSDLNVLDPDLRRRHADFGAPEGKARWQGYGAAPSTPV